MSEGVPGVLWLIATPIGNLDDITLRALKTLRQADLVLAEDTRHTRTLAHHHGIETPLASFHAHTGDERRKRLAQRIAAGERVALVTDAGTPAVSDPGAELTAEVLALGGRVEVLPGPSAVLTALLSSGLRSDQFRFVGFLPRSGTKRARALAGIARDRFTSVVFESPRRAAATLGELAEHCEASRRAAICRELTKLHEQTLRGTFPELVEQLGDEVRGEVTLVVEGHDGKAPLPQQTPTEELDLDAAIRARLGRGQPAKQIARELARERGLDRRSLYQRISALKSQEHAER